MNKHRSIIYRHLTKFQQEREKSAGTKELAKFLKEKQIPEPILTELMPEELARLTESDMEVIQKRCDTLSTRSLLPLRTPSPSLWAQSC